jgi:nucleoside 2-deoxyribosyltransferase
MKKLYLAGQFSEYDNWKEEVKAIDGFDFFDPEFDSDQSTPDNFYPDDLTAVKNSDILIASPGTSPCEGTWIEVGYFIATHTKTPGDFCESLIIIWPKERIDWSIEFVKKSTVFIKK